jgi:hypothetical protein
MPSNQTSDAPRCGVKLKSGPTKNNPSGTCRRFPREYQKRCPLHGGNLPNARVAAERARIEEKIGKAAQRLGVADAIADPLRALQKLAGEVVQWKDLCREELAALTSVGYASEQSGEQVRAEIIVWERALDRAITVLASLARLNIDERLARIEEQQAAMVRQAFAAGLEEIGIGPEQRAIAARVVAKHLRIVEAA